MNLSRCIILVTGKALFRCFRFSRNQNTHQSEHSLFEKNFVFCVKSMINYASGIFIIKQQRLAALFYPSPSLNIEHAVKTVTSRLFHRLAIDRFQSRDHFTIGRHTGTQLNSELVAREL